jgi:hypothetical protein
MNNSQQQAPSIATSQGPGSSKQPSIATIISPGQITAFENFITQLNAANPDLPHQTTINRPLTYQIALTPPPLETEFPYPATIRTFKTAINIIAHIFQILPRRTYQLRQDNKYLQNTIARWYTRLETIVPYINTQQKEILEESLEYTQKTIAWYYNCNTEELQEQLFITTSEIYSPQTLLLELILCSQILYEVVPKSVQKHTKAATNSYAHQSTLFQLIQSIIVANNLPFDQYANSYFDKLKALQKAITKHYKLQIPASLLLPSYY